MSLKRLTAYKGLGEKDNLLDRMGKAELAANLFRITQTEQKIANQDIRGQQRLQDAAFDVGKEVRNTMQRVSGTTPEELPIAENIKQVRRTLKGTQKQLKNDPRPESGG